MNSTITNCKILYNQSTGNNLNIVEKAGESRSRFGFSPDPKCSEKNAVSRKQYIQDLTLSGLRCLYYDLCDWYTNKEESRLENFRDWNDMNNEEKNEKNQWDHCAPFIKKSQIKMLDKGLIDEIKSMKENKKNNLKRNKSIKIKNETITYKNKRNEKNKTKS